MDKKTREERFNKKYNWGRFEHDNFIHLRMWSNNKYDLDMLCGKFDRKKRKGKTLKYTYNESEVTCNNCLNKLKGE